MSALFGEPYRYLFARSVELVYGWEDLFKIYFLYTQKNKKDPQKFHSILSKLEEIIVQEDEFIDSIMKWNARYATTAQGSPYGKETSII
jgi:hypothetical protein